MDHYIHLEPTVKLQPSSMFTHFSLGTRMGEVPCQTDIWKYVSDIIALGQK